MKGVIWQLRFFFGTVLLMTLISGLILLTTEKETIHMTINACHSSFWDVFFRFYTHVGDGIFVAIAGLVIALLTFHKDRWTPFVIGGLTLILSGAIAQLLKRLFFDSALRPSAYLKEHILHIVEGVQMHAHHSFPSGHTTAGFAFFSYAALYLARKKPLLQVVFALLAGLIGYSRMYLSQHFLEDVFTGMLLGTFCTLLVIVLFRKQLNAS